jgi:hypothetical protein
MLSHKFCLNVYADGSVMKEVWPLIAQSEPSVISAQLVIPVAFLISTNKKI